MSPTGNGNTVKDLWTLLNCLETLQGELVAWCRNSREDAR
jgi:hypothetical protein